MNSTPDVTDDRLRESVLTDTELLSFELEHPGAIRVLAAFRYRARLMVLGGVWEFQVTKLERNGREFTAVPGPVVAAAPESLRLLAFHRAAEAMLALRKGHKEFILDKRKQIVQE